MNSLVRIPLNPSPEQAERLLALQTAFAELCNAIAPLVQQTRIWNRVTLHHMAYKSMRERFPALGSQMVCNAVYSVSRAARIVFQSPASPFRLQRADGGPLPRLHFHDSAPVFFDRHTLNLKDGQLSMYTLDGRMRFHLDLQAEVEQQFRTGKLREVLMLRAPLAFELRFRFDIPGHEAPSPSAVVEWPEYLVVLPDEPGDPDTPGLPAAAIFPAPPVHPQSKEASP